MAIARRVMYRGTIEYLEVTVTADVQLTGQPVYFSFDQVTWTAGEWDGEPGLTRTARILLGEDVPLPTKSSVAVYLKVTDSPEVPIMNAGILVIRSR